MNMSEKRIKEIIDTYEMSADKKRFFKTLISRIKLIEMDSFEQGQTEDDEEDENYQQNINYQYEEILKELKEFMEKN